MLFSTLTMLDKLCMEVICSMYKTMKSINVLEQALFPLLVEMTS